LREGRFENLFGSPVLSRVWSDASELNPSLRDAILGHRRQHPGRDLTNFGGWHSAPGTLEFCGDCGRRLVAHMREMIDEATARLFAEFGRAPQATNWIFSAWANVNRHGDFNETHTHPGATWSGVYYVDDGENDPAAAGTAIHLYDPYPARTNIFFPELSASSITFRPHPGLMLLFPSYVPHAVPPHSGDRPRISVAFNVRRDPFP
jgi:uncharacterized protein (TIGR02466 family)